jgi:hypothetical protein
MSVRKAAGLMIEPTIQLAGWSRATPEDVRLYEAEQAREKAAEQRLHFMEEYGRKTIFNDPVSRKSWLEGDWYDEAATIPEPEFKELPYKGVKFNVIDEAALIEPGAFFALDISGSPVVREAKRKQMIRKVKPLCGLAAKFEKSRKFKEPCPWCGNYHE